MKYVKFPVLTTIVLVLFAGCTTTQSKVTGVIDQMPAENSQQRDALAAELVDLNPEATLLLAEMLLPPTDPNDTAARYGLSALTHYTARDGAEAEREVYVAALIDALEVLPEKQNQAFLISQLQLVGNEEAARTLGGYLNDKLLCDYAARAMLTIGTDSVEAAFLAAMETAPEANKVTVIKALGQLQSKAAVEKITPFAKSQNRQLRDTALYALANIGDASAQKTLGQASRTENAYDRGQYTALYLLFAQRQAEAGNVNQCAQICSQVIRRSRDNPGRRAAAVNTLRASVAGDLEKISNPKLQQRVKKLLADADVSTDAKQPPKGFVSLFNGRDLTGWKRHDGLPGETEPAGRWFVENGAIVGVQDPPGKGGFLTTADRFGDFELTLETKIDWPFDTGVFLRVGPDGKSHQVTLDYRDGGEIGGIYCPWTQGFVHHCPDGIKHFKKDQWNKLRITCEGEPARIRAWLNGTEITDFQHTAETTAGIPEEGTICLQIHPGGKGYDKSQTRFRNIFVRPLVSETVNVLSDEEKSEGFVRLFNGTDLTGWVGATDSYGVKDGILFCRKGTGRNIYTEKQYDNFVLRFDFKLEPGTNNGLGIRTPTEGDAAYVGMELQILDNTAAKYSNLHDWQYHGSVYGIIPADKTKRYSAFKPVGEWNREEVIANGNHITVKVNGETIVDGNIQDAIKSGTLSGKEHPGLFNKTGHIGFLGHGDYIEFRNLRIKKL